MKDDYFPETQVIKRFERITLEETDRVRLMNRSDTKFVFTRKLLNEVLPELLDTYKVLDVEGNLLSRYRTLYFDTDKLKFYLDHHNGRLSRYKVRIRQYIESDIFFLEVKHKFKGRTIKDRVRISGFEEELSEESKKFIEEVIGEEVDLSSALWNTFGRITMVNKFEKERLTIDVDLGFENENREEEYEDIVIAELKQEEFNRQSCFYSVMKKNHVRPTGMSKYCLGTITLDPSVKYNNFKRKELLISKLST